MEKFLDKVLQPLSFFLSGWDRRDVKDWETLVKKLTFARPRTNLYLFLAALFTTGFCALLSAVFSVVLLAKPRLYYVYYLPT